MQSQLQGVEIESVRRRYDDLAVHHAVPGQAIEQSLVELREIAIERSSIAALDVHSVRAAKYDRPKAVPLRFIKIVAGRQLFRELGEHRLDRRLHGKC